MGWQSILQRQYELVKNVGLSVYDQERMDISELRCMYNVYLKERKSKE